MIRTYHVNKVYGDNIQALKDITLKIERGEFVFLVGPSGTGKTTLLKLLFGAEKPTSGQILINNINITKIKRSQLPYLRRKIGFVFQDFKLFNYKTVFENVAFALEVVGAKRQEIKTKVQQVLGMVDLSNKTYEIPLNLSGGERQRVAIARSLVHNPFLILADEPTGNLDSHITLDIINLLGNINAFGTTVIVSTHNQEMVKRYNRRFIGLERGRIVNDKLSSDFSLVGAAG